MPQSLANVLVHVVFSTKHRHAFLRDPEHRGVMTGYLVGTMRNLKCPSVITGVVEDHVHILCNLHRTVSIAQLVEEI
jgi:REP element-mobilizing transposase RayT